MPQLLLELFSEEIPARMQANAARDLERMARERLAAEGLLPEALTAFAGPRRLTLVAEGLPAAQADRHEERKGPRVGSPDQAIEGFLRSTGLTRDQLIERDGLYFAHLHKAGRPTPQIVAEMVEAIVRNFPWPKSMVSGVSKLRWVRPLQRILCVFDGEIVPFEIDGHVSGDLTEGHRFMGSGQAFRVRNFDDYADGLARNFVVLDPEERKERILDAARTLCFARNFELVEDEGLLDEVAGLAEWPTPVMGDMDPAFLDLPPEVIRTSMRVHQRFFAVRDPQSGFLVPHFITVANIEATDGGKLIASGNARVLSARLSDARFFWEEDQRTKLEDRLEKLKGVTFHAKLGTMYERVERIEALAAELAPYVRDDEGTKAFAVRAARLCKADLGTGMVGEFPELQGIMGAYYAEKEGYEPEVIDAIRSHYRPQGPNDDVPVQAVAATVALADKLDTLVSFFAIDEKPTGSRDPYALRRAALGVIRIILATRTRIPLLKEVFFHTAVLAANKQVRSDEEKLRVVAQLEEFMPGISGRAAERLRKMAFEISENEVDRYRAIALDLIAFFADRLKVLLREQGQRHDLVDAVFALDEDDIVLIVSKVNALEGFLGTEDGKNLLAGYKRAVNILKAEEKKGALPSGEPVAATGEEGALYNAVGHMEVEVEKALAKEDYEAAMTALAALREPVDAFFDKVLVNSDVAAERDNRLRLLLKVRDAMGRVADFSQITG
ncbi:MAG TPA: glycine--tRNA ligase subunit beta [Phenylobacterium sp.]|uniref:glycine--tRNA ligase subunit beta n=1 Tax=Phenylobacterium sp. TaxID=1871053 RepID=UPI002D491672|nr:glycine--tRNA ligase subunit beta [Phenylobacterium sp.]HZZ66920.1 glycine--tRNA ligase subunit beta [Phenylobacterium sp.]